MNSDFKTQRAYTLDPIALVLNYQINMQFLCIIMYVVYILICETRTEACTVYVHILYICQKWRCCIKGGWRSIIPFSFPQSMRFTYIQTYSGKNYSNIGLKERKSEKKIRGKSIFMYIQLKVTMDNETNKKKSSCNKNV